MFEVFTIICYEDMEGNTKCTNYGRLGQLGVTQEHRQCRRATQYIRLPVHLSVLYRFRVIESYLSKVANFNIHHLHFAPPLRVTPFDIELCRDFRHQKTRIPAWAIVWRCLRDPTLSRFSRTPTCDRQTDRQTDGQADTRRQLIPSLARIARVKRRDIYLSMTIRLMACLHQNLISIWFRVWRCQIVEVR